MRLVDYLIFLLAYLASRDTNTVASDPFFQAGLMYEG